MLVLRVRVSASIGYKGSNTMKFRILLNILLCVLVLGGAVRVAYRLVEHGQKPAQRGPAKNILKVQAEPIAPSQSCQTHAISGLELVA